MKNKFTIHLFQLAQYRDALNPGKNSREDRVDVHLLIRFKTGSKIFEFKIISYLLAKIT